MLGPTLGRLRPFARRLEAVNLSLGRTARETFSPIKDEIRPFVQVARKPVRDLRPAAANLSDATPRLTAVVSKLNKLFNMAAYNPGGASGCPRPLPCTEGGNPRDEGYLYWLGWLSHVGNSTFQNQDAHGVYRRVFLAVTQRGGLRDRGGQPAGGRDPAVRPDRHRTRLPLGDEREDDAKASTISRQDHGRGRLRAVLLRPAALPLGHLRRSGPVQARELPLHRRLPRGAHPAEGSRRPDRRRLRRQGEGSRAAPRGQRDPRRDRDRAPVRADLLRRGGDPAAEDAAGRDLHRAHHRHPEPRAGGGERRQPPRSPGRSTSARSPATTRRTRSPRAAISRAPRSPIRPKSTTSSTASTSRLARPSSSG